MANRILQAKDTINGKYGTAFAVINGSRYELFYLKKFTATAKQHKSTISRLGAYYDGHKVVGAEGTWTAELRYVTDVFREMIVEADKSNKTIYFDLHISNDDPDSDAGRHSDVFKNCTLDDVILSQLDADNTSLDESLSGTFDDHIPADRFKL